MKPGVFPQTAEQREAAAKKYYLYPEEYCPYADDGLGYGDYPNINIGYGYESKDEYYPYDYPEHKRNLHEVVGIEIKSIKLSFILPFYLAAC